MTIAEKIKENLPYGQAVLNKLFELKSDDLRAKVKEILQPYLGDRVEMYPHLFNEGEVSKVIRNDESWNIVIAYHDRISIDALGISAKDEHASNGKILVWFDKDFKYE